MLIRPASLRRLGIMGMNDRNINYIARYNPRRLYPLVDNKLKTKLIAEDAGITVPPLIGAVKTQHDLEDVPAMVAGHSGFAIKPAKGSGGKGILVITGHKDGRFIKSSGVQIGMSAIRHHITNVLSGLYSLGGSPDVAIIESLILTDPRYEPWSIGGVPDIRVIVYRGFPVMAMMRLATRASDGKANLHMGAVGVGLDIRTGCAVNAVQSGGAVTEHPDSGNQLGDLVVADWDQYLELGARCADVTGLGYLGADIVPDRTHGPMLIELNARPGLAIQVANRRGLKHRVRAVDKLPADAFRQAPAMRCQVARDLIDSVESALTSQAGRRAKQQ